jgi:four helix bundle protein
VRGKGESKKWQKDGNPPPDRKGLEDFGAYRKANELFDLVVADMNEISNRQLCWKLIAQQLGSADSICANMEEGYGRYSPKEYIQYLVISRGSAQETRGRYNRMRHWLSPAIVTARIALCDEILGILTTSINTLKR